MQDPCAFSPHTRQARRTATTYAAMFPTGSTVVDVGFGQGHFLEVAAEHGHRAIGIDRDAQLVADAKARGLDAITADVRDIADTLGQPVDGIMASHLIEHLPADDLTAVLTDMAGVLRPGGIAVLTTPNLGDWRVASEWFWLDPTHVRPYPPGAVRQLLDPDLWDWDADGFEPMVVTRHTPVEWLQRVRFGGQYGKPGRWYRLRRR